MPDVLDAQGLQIATLNEITAQLQSAYMSIYGSDINLDQNSPDGQVIGIFSQASEDIRELALQIYNSMDPDRSVGRVLDERVVYNNIKRLGGTFTIVPISVTTDRTVTLQGLDSDFNNVNGTGYTVQDNAGTKFILVDTQTLTAGTTVLNFRAQEIGLVETTINTITNPVTIVLGVTAINNPSAALEVGQDEETDAELRIRRRKSVSLASTGYLNGLLGAVLNLDGVTDGKLYENVEDTVDSNGIPAHGVWLIVEGGANSEIAEAIYERKSYGSNMKGSVVVPIITASGNVFNAKFDRPVAATLYIRFNIQRTVANTLFDVAGIKNYIVNNLSYNIGEYAGTTNLTALAQEGLNATSGGGIVTDMEVSSNGSTWVDYLPAPTLGSQWTLASANIGITVLP